MKRALLPAILLGLTSCQVRSLELRQFPPDGGGGSGLFGGSGGSGVDGFLTGGSTAAGGTFGGSPTGGAGGVGGAPAGGTGGTASGGAGGNCPNGRDEICNGVDDDCDNMVDEGFDLATDPQHCGSCAKTCSFSHAAPLCQAGQCALGACFDGYADADHQPANGCECLFTNNKIEICDGQDNDCDGMIDEDFDFKSSTTHCGGCFKPCAFAQASASCVNGVCTLGACMAGYTNTNNDARDGCEYRCTTSGGGAEVCDGQDNDCDGMIDNNTTDGGQACGGMPGGTGECRQGKVTCVNGTLICLGAGTPGAELCDGKDNDCDGMTDEDDPFVGKACYPVGVAGCDVTAGTCTGPCKLGSWACSAGRLACNGVVVPALETCDNVDNDCDGTPDEGYDKQNDPRFCGGCNTKCQYTNAIALCQNGACTRGPCLPGWTDTNGNPADGCEYQCTFEGVEACDGKDNDCDGLTDAADPDLQYPTINFCSQLGECGQGPGGSTRYPGARSFPVCTTPAGASRPDWTCNYPGTVETVAGSPNTIVTQETLCDGKDNDCDGASDEQTTNRPGTTCADATGMGQCQRQGTYRCQSDPKADTACDFAGVPVTTPSHEVCDGKDNDCDGLIDESWDNPSTAAFARCASSEVCRGVRDDVAQLTSGGSALYIYRYESSRADASGAGQGSSAARACSRAGVLPWTVVNQAQALAACQKAGMRLCSATEWGDACKGSQACTSNYFPYACTFNATTCNGAERNLGGPLPTGMDSACTTTGAAGTTRLDMSGNVSEWTSQQQGMLGTKRIFILRGGSFNNYEPALRCDSSLLAFAEDYAFTDAGFRCCSRCAPGQADCNGTCVNLGASNGNCGACGTACAGGQSCLNGRCQ
jgi:hypothetical protein